MCVCVCLCLLRYLCVDYVALDLLLCDRDVLQNHLQSHRHHAGHPVNQTGADVTWHPPLEQNNVFYLTDTFSPVFCDFLGYILSLNC